MVKYLEPIPIDSFIRHRLLKLFTDVGLEDFQAQILLSIVLHGGQIKPITLARDIQCNTVRLELPDGFPSLLDLNLIVMSHTRPKTVILAIGIDELIERLSIRTIKPNYLMNPKEAQELLFKLDQLCLLITPDHDDKNKIDYFTSVFDYYDKLQQLMKKLPSLPSLIYYALVSLWMEENYAIILSKLIACGGKISKRDFFLEYIKNIDQKMLFDNSRLLEDDFKSLGYVGDNLKRLIEKSTAFFNQKRIDLKLSGEHQFNMALNCLRAFCLSTSMGKKEETRKFKYLTIIVTLSQLADSLYESVIDFKRHYKSELQILKKAYSNVKLIDREIFLSSIADPSSTRKRLETDIQHAKKIYLVLIHPYFAEDIFLKIFYSENIGCKLNLIVAEEQKELFIEMLNVYNSVIQGKRGILPDDSITFTPSDDIPQDVLIGNTVILFYKVGSSMIIIHEEITKRNPTEINTIPDDVELASKYFKEIQKDNLEKTKTIISLINKRGK